MVFPLPVGPPLSVYENVLRVAPRWGPRTAELDELVERCLRQAMLWEEVKDRLTCSARALRRTAAALTLARSPTGRRFSA